MLKTKKVSDRKILPLEKDKKLLVRSGFVKNPRNVTLIAAPIGSGKTTLASNLISDAIAFHPLQKRPENKLPECSIRVLDAEHADINTPKYERKLTFLIFTASAYTDPKWKQMIQKIVGANCKCSIEMSTYTEDGMNLLQQTLLKLLKAVEKERENEDSEDEYNSDDDIDTIAKKLMAPIESDAGNFFVIFDDLTDEYIRNFSILRFIKLVRHNNIVHLLCISQDVIDFKPSYYRQAHNVILFKDIQPSKLKELHDKLALKIPFEALTSMYKQATEEPHSFLNIDRSKHKYYINFTDEFEV